MSRKRTVPAARADVWHLVSDPYNLPRWWPRTLRAEGVEGDGAGAQWTSVLGTAEGRGVRADFRCRKSVVGERVEWEQLIEGTPFQRHLRRYEIEIGLRDEGDGGDGTEVDLAASQALRGLSRLGSPMMRGAQGRILEEALDGIERALAGGGE